MESVKKVMDRIRKYDAVVIGGGFYGCAIALYLKKKGLPNILLLEREEGVLSRASYHNQARVHNGYHYPRSFITGFRSKINFPIFSKDYEFALKKDFISLYAISRKNSKVTPLQYERFMKDLGIEFDIAYGEYRKCFDERMVSSVYQTQEYCFDAKKLKDNFLKQFAENNIELSMATEVTSIAGNGNEVSISASKNGTGLEINTSMLFNCTYSGLNKVVSQRGDLTPLKHEFTEMCLIKPPAEFSNASVTIMDGHFFSVMPFPAENCHSISHVNYTPHSYFIDKNGKVDPVTELKATELKTRFNHMIADASRYVPVLRSSEYIRSMFEVKTVLVQNESSDGRPILFRRESSIHPNMFSVLGGKIDNIYDVYKQVDGILDVNRGQISQLIS